MERVTIDGVEITLGEADTGTGEWLDYGDYARQLEAAWLRLSEAEPPLNPRLIGEPGLGKTTLAGAVGRRMGREVYIFQCTMDTRPEDLLIAPVLTGQGIEYRASSVVSAMVRGGVLILDEGNRMPERAWASLAPLMDDRRSIESSLAAVRVRAHPNFRLCVTMNDDASVYELPGYIQSRLKPKIEVLAPPPDMQKAIVRLKCPDVDEALLTAVLHEIRKRAQKGQQDSMRDVLSLAQYAQKLQAKGIKEPLKTACAQVLRAASTDDAHDDMGDVGASEVPPAEGKQSKRKGARA